MPKAKATKKTGAKTAPRAAAKASKAEKAAKAPQAKATKPAKATKKPARKRAHPGREFTAAEVATIQTKVAHVQAPTSAAKLALAKRAIADMEDHLEKLERDRKEIRSFLRTAKRGAAKKGSPRARGSRRRRRR